MIIPFNLPVQLGRELEYVKDAMELRSISGNGKYTKLCQSYLSEAIGNSKVFLTPSCTDALEMGAILSFLSRGDEVILPSYTFTSTANAVVLRDATPVFVDIRSDTLNIDEEKIEAAITPRTKAIMVVHYAGVSCEMDRINEIARENGLVVIEDAAQALHASYKDLPLGSLGDLGAFSFHETKNIISGEGGALVVNNPDLVHRAEIVWEKGTNRMSFSRGEVNFYEWVDIGSSFLPSEITAAFLFAQLEQSREATERRLALWRTYGEALAPLEHAGKVLLPHPPDHCEHNGHIFYVLAPTVEARGKWLKHLAACGINAVSHYVPLHSSPAGRRFGQVSGSMSVTDDIAGRIIRLPLHLNLSNEDQAKVAEALQSAAFGL